VREKRETNRFSPHTNICMLESAIFTNSGPLPFHPSSQRREQFAAPLNANPIYSSTQPLALPFLVAPDPQTNCASNLHTGMQLAISLLQQHPRARPLTFSLSAGSRPSLPPIEKCERKDAALKRSHVTFIPLRQGSIRRASSPANPQPAAVWILFFGVTAGQRPPSDPFSARLEGVSTCIP
jgi:hypothetical protein